MTPDESLNFEFEEPNTVPPEGEQRVSSGEPSYPTSDLEDPWSDADLEERSDSSSSLEDALAEAFGDDEPLSGNESGLLELPNLEPPVEASSEADAESSLYTAFAEPERPLGSIDLTEPPASQPEIASTGLGLGEPLSFGGGAIDATASYGDKSSLQQQKQALQQEIADLQKSRDQLREQLADAQMAMGRLVQDGLKELESRKQALQISVEQLERRQERIRNEMRTTFAGVSQDLAIRVQSFKDYLVGSLQDLALTAEQLELPKPSKEPERKPTATAESPTQQASSPRFAEQTFQEQTRKIRGLIDQYRNRPDYYGPTWQLRRTFEPIHAERVSNWFLTQGGRGAIRTMGSRLQNILVASATISILYSLYGDRLRTLILADSPERLGEWRRGLQDCLGITRGDFGPDRGVALFEDPELMAQKADRSQKDGLMPLIVMDETEEQISLSVLQFPLWLAFAPNPQAPSSNSYRDRDW